MSRTAVLGVCVRSQLQELREVEHLENLRVLGTHGKEEHREQEDHVHQELHVEDY